MGRRSCELADNPRVDLYVPPGKPSKPTPSRPKAPSTCRSRMARESRTMLSAASMLLFASAAATSGDWSADSGGHRRLQGSPADPPHPTHGTQMADVCDAATPLTTVAGTVHNYPDPPPQRAKDCGRLISAPQGSSVEITFSSMSLGRVVEGDGDREPTAVLLYDGRSSASPLLASFHGNQLPPVVRSTGPDLFVRFLRRGNAAAPQTFFADWSFVDSTQAICAARMVVTARHGSIVGGEEDLAAQAGPNLDCGLTLHAPTLSTIMLSFSRVELGTCAAVVVYDGWDANAPQIATLSASTGTSTSQPVVSSGQDVHVRLIAAPGGLGCAAGWGFAADWSFQGQGLDICNPPAAVLTGNVGVLHDDAPDGDVDCSSGHCGDWTALGAAGYSDNMDCGVRIHAEQPGQKINLHFTQLNLEGPAHIPGCEPCDYKGCDYVEIYDGADSSHGVPIATVSGTNLDDRLDTQGLGRFGSWTSSSSDIFVRFVTNAGNCGLRNTISDPGFFLHWQMIDQGEPGTCDAFPFTQDLAIRGHNTEEKFPVSMEECTQACCDRQWCRSFDYNAEQRNCGLSDVDSSSFHADTVVSPGWRLYERPMESVPPAPPLGPGHCQEYLAAMANTINNVCCDDGAGCSRHPPRVCSQECSVQWQPFEQHCSEWAKQEPTMASIVAGISAQCEVTTFGRYKPPAPSPTPAPTHGRCSDGDYNAWVTQLSPACCGNSFTLCRGAPLTADVFEAGSSSAGLLPTRCGGGCPALFEQFYLECHPRIEAQGAAAAATKFLALCQDQQSGGGGHR